MTRIDQISALLDNASSEAGGIERLYNESLTRRSLNPQLLIKIKNLLENLRSALDFVAREIFDRYCAAHATKASVAVYFPILCKSATLKEFQAFMNGRFPNLDQAQPALYSKLQGYQYFTSSGNEWLVQFRELCNENKHEQLSPQVRTEFVEHRLTIPGGAGIAWTEGVTFSGGVSLLGRPIDPSTQLPQAFPGDRLEKITWVDFQFKAIGVSALSFLKTCVERVRTIISETETEMGV